MSGHAEAGDWRAALRRAEEYVRHAPEDARGWLAASRAALRRGQPARADSHLRRAVALTPDAPGIEPLRRELRATGAHGGPATP